jgi:hypothetical protein
MAKSKTLNSIFTTNSKEEMQERTEHDFIILKAKMEEEKSFASTHCEAPSWETSKTNRGSAAHPKSGRANIEERKGKRSLYKLV